MLEAALARATGAYRINTFWKGKKKGNICNNNPELRVNAQPSGSFQGRCNHAAFSISQFKELKIYGGRALVSPPPYPECTCALGRL